MEIHTLCIDTSAFPLGDFIVTPNARAVIPHAEILAALARHARCDWGDLEPCDWYANECTLRKGGRLLSQYQSSQKVIFWIVTEADRSVTKVLLPEDY